jgi:hypothetical protein
MYPNNYLMKKLFLVIKNSYSSKDLKYVVCRPSSVVVVVVVVRTY